MPSMRRINWKRVLGLVVATVSLFQTYMVLFFGNQVVRSKGFDAPLIDVNALGEAFCWALLASFGVLLFLREIVPSGCKTDTMKPGTAGKTPTQSD
jgi:hypothetical protein